MTGGRRTAAPFEDALLNRLECAVVRRAARCRGVGRTLFRAASPKHESEHDNRDHSFVGHGTLCSREGERLNQSAATVPGREQPKYWLGAAICSVAEKFPNRR